ncbi:MAG: deoxyribonuclease IV [Actinobacteria bacterium]|nr:deoxyribonuclease IV [Actinomycetota bacterium]
MLIGAHVSTSGGLIKAIERGTEFGCTAIQIFNQSPRMWRPTAYDDADFAAFREAMEASPIDAVVIHAIYLINPGSTDKELAKKSLDSLTHALRVGDAIGSAGVVLHPGHVKDETYAQTIKRIAGTVKKALKASESCRVLLENAAGRKAVGCEFGQLRDLIDLLDGDPRVGVCVDSCHSHAAGYDVRTIDAVTATVDQLDAAVGLDRLHALHLNDSRDEFESHRDRHANLGEGMIGKSGMQAFLSEPRFEGLPMLMEIPGTDKEGPGNKDVALARKLREQGQKARSAA